MALQAAGHEPCRQWEYKERQIHREELLKSLRQEGADGWEACFVAPHENGTLYVSVYFKRRVPKGVFIIRSG